MSHPSAAQSDTLDQLDRQIVRCLQLRPRAPFSRVGEVLGVSEQTVARRYQRLQRRGVIRVIAAVNPTALGESDWIVRLQCRPDGTLDLGRALAQRDDVAWVSVSAGGSEIACALRSHTQVDRDRLLLDRLPRTSGVLDISASVILRRFSGGSASDWAGVRDALDAEQVRRLEPDSTNRNPAPSDIVLDAADYAMLGVLACDGRTPLRDLARAAGTTEGRVTRRLATLFDRGVLYLDIDLAGSAIGYPISAYLWLTVPPSALEATCTALATHDEAPFVAAVTGRTNVTASVTCRSYEHLYRYVTTRVAALDGVQSFEISPIVRRFKQAGALVDDGRLVLPERRRRTPAASAS